MTIEQKWGIAIVFLILIPIIGLSIVLSHAIVQFVHAIQPGIDKITNWLTKP